LFLDKTFYAQKSRSVLANLRSNSALRDQLITGFLLPSTLATMSEEDMADEQRKKQRVKERSDALVSAILKPDDLNDENATPVAIGCPSCSGFDCLSRLLVSKKSSSKGDTWGAKDVEDSC
jgi:hypothetical protein